MKTLLLSIFLILILGCSGRDGAQGPAGPSGFQETAYIIGHSNGVVWLMLSDSIGGASSDTETVYGAISFIYERTALADVKFKMVAGCRLAKFQADSLTLYFQDTTGLTWLDSGMVNTGDNLLIENELGNFLKIRITGRTSELFNTTHYMLVSFNGYQYNMIKEN